MMKNKFASRAKISETQVREILRLFVLDMNASQIAKVLDINRNTVNRYVMAIRDRIARHCHRGCCLDRDHGPMKIDLVSGVKGRNPSSNNVLICLFAEQGNIYTEIVPQRLTGLLQAIMRGKVRADGVLAGLGIANCLAIADLGNHRISYLLPDQGNGGNVKKMAIAPIGRFWGALKLRMVKMRGIKRSSLPLHLKECEFRFNNAQQGMFSLLLSFVERDHLF